MDSLTEGIRGLSRAALTTTPMAGVWCQGGRGSRHYNEPRAVNCQLQGDPRMKRCVALLPLILVLSPSPAAGQDESKAGVAIKANKEYIDFRVGKSLVARYHIASSVAKPYFWPVRAPNGIVLTRDWPMEKASG